MMLPEISLFLYVSPSRESPKILIDKLYYISLASYKNTFSPLVTSFLASRILTRMQLTRYFFHHFNNHTTAEAFV